MITPWGIAFNTVHDRPDSVHPGNPAIAGVPQQRESPARSNHPGDLMMAGRIVEPMERLSDGESIHGSASKGEGFGCSRNDRNLRCRLAELASHSCNRFDRDGVCALFGKQAG